MDDYDRHSQKIAMNGIFTINIFSYIKTCVKQSLSIRPKISFQDQLSLNAGQWEHFAILSTFIKLPFDIKIFVLSILSGSITQVLLYCVKANRKSPLLIQSTAQHCF